jgi:hypothetical protein
MAKLIVNVTTRVTPEIESAWLKWLRDEHLPGILSTECFCDAVILKLMEADETSGPTFAVQFHANEEADFERYLQNFDELFLQQFRDKWGEQALSFRTILKVVH